jgi:hypothetical protein
MEDKSVMEGKSGLYLLYIWYGMFALMPRTRDKYADIYSHHNNLFNTRNSTYSGKCKLIMGFCNINV